MDIGHGWTIEPPKVRTNVGREGPLASKRSIYRFFGMLGVHMIKLRSLAGDMDPRSNKLHVTFFYDCRRGGGADAIVLRSKSRNVGPVIGAIRVI